MRIYVAGKYEDRLIIRSIHKTLIKMGHEITVDWTNHDIYPNDAAALKQSQFAQDDVIGVLDADLFIGLMLEEHYYKGLWCEMGIALGKGIPIYIIGDKGNSCIFINHPSVRKFASITDCIKDKFLVSK